MGIVAAYSSNGDSNCAYALQHGIFNINHTGQEYCGIAVYDGKDFQVERDGILVRNLRIPEKMRGRYGVGNVNKYGHPQPRVFNSPRFGHFALTFDGFIANRGELKRRVGGVFSTLYDVELAAHLICEGDDFPSGMRNMAEQVKGAYSVAIASEGGDVYAARCPLGIKPLIIGEGDCHGVVTESRALQKMGMMPVRDVVPGEILRINNNGVTTLYEGSPEGQKLCSFQWAYFAWVDSIVDGIPVSSAREQINAVLAKKDKEAGLEIDFVCGVEDSGKAHGEGYAMEFGAPYLSAVIKYPYAIRSYDRPEEELRHQEAANKVSAVSTRIKGKRIVVCDDSIRRGTVIEEGPIRLLKEAGAKEIHLRIGSPRNVAYCRFDDRKEDSELMANRFPTDEDIANHLGIESVMFPGVDEFVEAVTMGSDLRERDLCLGCYTGNFGFLE